MQSRLAKHTRDRIQVVTTEVVIPITWYIASIHTGKVIWGVCLTLDRDKLLKQLFQLSGLNRNPSSPREGTQRIFAPPRPQKTNSPPP